MIETLSVRKGFITEVADFHKSEMAYPGVFYHGTLGNGWANIRCPGSGELRRIHRCDNKSATPGLPIAPLVEKTVLHRSTGFENRGCC